MRDGEGEEGKPLFPLSIGGNSGGNGSGGSEHRIMETGSALSPSLIVRRGTVCAGSLFIQAARFSSLKHAQQLRAQTRTRSSRSSRLFQLLTCRSERSVDAPILTFLSQIQSKRNRFHLAWSADIPHCCMNKRDTGADGAVDWAEPGLQRLSSGGSS